MTNAAVNTSRDASPTRGVTVPRPDPTRPEVFGTSGGITNELEVDPAQPTTRPAPGRTGHPILARHTRHRVLVVDDRTLRCVDCQHTLDVSVKPAAVTPTSTSSSLPPTRAEACPLHGGRRGSCSGCRADELVAEQTEPAPYVDLEQVRRHLVARRQPAGLGWPA